MDKVLWFAEVWPNHPQPTKTAEVCLVQTKWTLISHCQLNLQILVWRKIFVFNLVVQVSILYKWPCSQCSVQQKWTLLAIHSYWCEETIVIMLVESKFSLNGSMEWWLHHPQPTKTTDVHTKTNADCRLCSASVIYSADVIGEIAQKNSQPKYIWQLTNLNHFRCNFCRSFANPPLNNPACLQYQICVAFVILNLWSMCALRLTQNHKVQFCLAGLSDFSAFQCNCSLSL